ncbi:MAG TPA: hypothetical protein PKV13_10465 [Propionicimonas sp.]|nr:hypothetical protein [Propionicimonas sp.]HRA07025.1 hypothetical protein [Propionicimonas sp.]
MEQDYYWVQAAPFRALLERTIEATGRPWPELARLAHVPLRLTHALLFGQNGRRLSRVPHDYARRILALADQLGPLPAGRAEAA